MKIPFFLFCFIISISQLFAQVADNESFFTVIQQDSMGGNITIEQDTAIKNLVLRDIESNDKKNGKIDGFRIQIASLSGRNAREESVNAKQNFLSIYSDFDHQQIYTLYQPPFFKVRIGNYRNKFEALKFYKDVLKHFPNAYLVKEQIKYPTLDKGDNTDIENNF